jgi:hypothetical protein
MIMSFQRLAIALAEGSPFLTPWFHIIAALDSNFIYGLSREGRPMTSIADLAMFKTLQDADKEELLKFEKFVKRAHELQAAGDAGHVGKAWREIYGEDLDGPLEEKTT